MINKHYLHTAAAVLISTSSVWSSPTTVDESYILRGFFTFDDSENMNTVRMIGDGAATFAFSNVAQHWVRVGSITEDGVVAVGQELSSDSGSSDFARTIDLYGDSKMGNHLFVGDENFAYYYTGGDWGTWSVQQIFEAPADYPAGEFGKHVYADHVDHDEFVVSCPLCGVDSIGQLYVYEKEGPKHSWTQAALLEAAQETSLFSCSDPPAGYSLLLGQDNVRISGDNILSTTYSTHCELGGFILWSKHRGQWSQQQTFWSSVHELTALAIEHDTIALAGPGINYASETNVGAVYIQYPNTPEYGAPKPPPGSPTQWSLHQILYPPDVESNLFFGNDMTIQDNRLWVGGSGSTADNTHLYYYERPSVGGYWSLQQVLDPPSGTKSMSAHTVFGTTVVALPINADPLTGAAIYENRYEWDCIIVSLEDQFGDGWDTAKLQITSPGAEPAFFSPHCNAPNPFEFRYCPRYSTPDYQGLYHLSIVDGPKSKFFWEIQWRVYEEGTGDWYRGNHATRMDFHFDAPNRKMSRRGIFHDLSSNITCVNCPAKPEEKPKPGPRMLKSDDTHAPTISPAPTLAQTVMTGDAWRYLILSTSGEPWFDEQHQGTNYYISDTQGHRLITTGTSCLDTPAMCYQVFPDGQYVLRVSGGLNKFSGDHGWEFCGRRGGAGEQLDFVVKDGKCDAIVSYTTGTYCSLVLHSSILVSVQLEIFGVSETMTVDELTEADLKALSTTLADLVGHDVSPSDIKLSAITNQFGHAVFDVTIRADAAKFGADPHDLDSMENVVTQMGTFFSNSAASGQLLTALTSTTIQGAYFFQNLEAVQFIDATLSSIDAHAEANSSPSVTDISEPVATESTESSTDYLFYAVVAGYAASVVALIGLVAYAYNQIRSIPTSVPVPATESKSENLESANAAPMKATTNTRKTQPKAVDATQKSQQMNTIMIADLIQMVKEEDEQLQKTMASDHFRV